MNLSIYALLRFDDDQNNMINVRARDNASLSDIFINNAITLSESLRKRGVRFVVLTNRKDFVCGELEKRRSSACVNVENIDFTIKVPDGINFYSAHFKIDVFRYFSSLERDAYVGLVDLDTVALNDIPQCLLNLIQNKMPLCYDISDQVIPAYGHSMIIREMEKLGLTDSEGRWSGGEFTMGTPDFYSLLCAEIDDIYGFYVRAYRDIPHQGEEIILSVALEKLRRKGYYIADAGTIGIVGRYWSLPVLHPQKPFKYYENCFLLHLPADKEFLGKLNSKDIESRDSFLKVYRPYLRRSRIFGFAKRLWRKKLSGFLYQWFQL